MAAMLRRLRGLLSSRSPRILRSVEGPVISIHARENAAHAEAVRDFARRIEAFGRPVRGYAVVVVMADGSVGSTYFADNEVVLVGAVESLKHRVLGEWR